MKVAKFLTQTSFIVLLTLPVVAQSWSQVDLKKLNRLVQSNDNQNKAQKDKSAQVFRLGRDFIEDGKWEDAEKALREFLRDYPNHKNTDAALYWLAFANKKQAHYQEVEKYLQQLAQSYPQSNWRDDAQALWLEIAPALTRNESVARAASAPRVVSVTSPLAFPSPAQALSPVAVATTIPPEFKQDALAPVPAVGVTIASGGDSWSVSPFPSTGVTGTVGISKAKGGGSAVSYWGEKGEPASEKDELKSIALQSLMQSDPDRALTYVVDILKSDKSSKYLKDTAIRLLGQYNGPKTTPYLIDLARGQYDVKLRRNAIFWLGQSKDDKVSDVLEELVTKSTDTEIAKAALFALSQRRDTRSRTFLYGIASGGQYKLLQNDAILRLGMWGDESAVEDLVKIYEASSELEIKKRVIQSLSQQSNPRARTKLLEIARSNGNDELRLQAVRFLSFRSDDGSLDELLKIYDNEKNVSVRKQILIGLAQNSSPKVTEKIRDVALNEKDTSVRLQAIFWLGQRGADNMNELIKLYDADSNEQVKSQIISSLSQSKSKAALQKLMQIAKNDASVNLRKRALMYIGQSRDPEATKFIEEILK